MEQEPDFKKLFESSSVESNDEKTIYIIGEIDTDIYETVIIPILELNEKESNFIVHDPIKIFISSLGGDVSSSLALADIIRTSKIPVYTYAIGECASAATFILISGAKRFGYKNTSFMIHEPTGGFGRDKFTNLKNNIKELDNINNRLIDLYKTRTAITPDMYCNMKSQEWWLTAKECLELEIIDEIL